MCLEELQQWQSCLPERENVSASVFIPDDVDQELSETQAEMLFKGLQLAGPSQDCEREFKSFWCLLLFGLCDDSGQRRLPSSDQCTSLQTDTCSEIIQIAATMPEYSGIIQNCDNFRFSSQPCGRYIKLLLAAPCMCACMHASMPPLKYIYHDGLYTKLHYHPFVPVEKSVCCIS